MTCYEMLVNFSGSRGIPLCQSNTFEQLLGLDEFELALIPLMLGIVVAEL